MSSWTYMALAAFMLAACSSGSAPHAAPPRTSTSVPAPMTDDVTLSAPSGPAGPARPESCGAGAQAFFLPTSHGIRLEANALGSGPAAVVFLHEVGRADMCGWFAYARWLTAHRHVRALLVNRCGYGRTSCPDQLTGDAQLVALTAPAVEWARAHGARRVTLVGASSGASDALEGGGVIPHVDAVVALSPDSTDTGVPELVSARRLRVPTLVVVAPHDPTSPVADVRSTYDHVAAARKRLVVATDVDATLDGAHGWLLVSDGTGQGVSRLGPVVADWVTGTAP